MYDIYLIQFKYFNYSREQNYDYSYHQLAYNEEEMGDDDDDVISFLSSYLLKIL